MTTDATLLGKIFAATRGDLDTAVFPFPRLEQVVRGMNLVRVRRMARFWKTEDHERAGSLSTATAEMVNGLHGLGCSWISILAGSRMDVQLWFGASQRGLEAGSLKALLSGTFPDVRIDDALPFDRRCFAALNHGVILTGTPGERNEGKPEKDEERIEKVCRGLLRERWLYAVYAKPVPAAETIATLNEGAETIRNARSTYLLKASATDEQNRIAQRYIELLEAGLKRFEQGRIIGMWETRTMLLTADSVSSRRGQALLQGAFGGGSSASDPTRVRPCDPAIRRGPRLDPLSSAEVAVLARPPLEAYPGYEVVDYARFGVEGSSNRSQRSHEPRVMIGEILDRGAKTSNALSLPFRDLTMHGLISGVTGSGKTNTCFSILDQVWNGGNGVPFMVIESAKSEYRNLTLEPRFAGVNVFTVGDENVSPLRLNPFEVPRGILIQTHIDYLKSLFQAAFVLYPPMPYVLEQSLQEVYEDRGWDLVRNLNWRGEDSPRQFPSLLDLEAKIATVVDRMGYDERLTMDVKAGLLARIKQLRMGGGKGLMLNTRRSTELSVLFESPCIIELKQIVNDDEKAFIIGLLLIRLYEYCESQAQRRSGSLHHLTLIEEAHRLLRNVSTDQNSEVAANPKGRAIEVFANILSEIRAYREGILIAEQIPAKLAPDALKNTNLKIVHRLVAADDRNALGAAMNLSESQSRYLVTLPAGEAVAFAQGIQSPVLLSIPLTPAKSNDREPQERDIKERMLGFWRRNPHLFPPAQACRGCPETASGGLCAATDTGDVGELMRVAATRLFNAIRLNNKLIRETYTDASVLHRRTQKRGQRTSLHCVLSGLFESEVERRAQFEGWPHREVDRILTKLSLSLATIGGLATNQDDRAARQRLVRELGEFTAVIGPLYQRELRPFPGCTKCDRPCYYRFDMALPGSDSFVKDFRAAFFDLGAETEEVARSCWHASSDSFAAPDTNSKQGAALCFAVQQLGALGLSRTNQETLSREIAEALGRLAGAH